MGVEILHQYLEVEEGAVVAAGAAAVVQEAVAEAEEAGEADPVGLLHLKHLFAHIV